MPPLWAEATNRACVRFNFNFEFNLNHKFTFMERRQMNKGGMLNRIAIGSEFLPAVNFEQAIVFSAGCLIELFPFSLCLSKLLSVSGTGEDIGDTCWKQVVHI